MLSNRRTLRIEWGDCDPAGIVYNPRFFEMLDWSTWLLFERALGAGEAVKMDMVKFPGMPLVGAGAKFFAPAKFGDTVEIESTVGEFRRSSFTVSHKMFKDGTLVLEGYETRVWTQRDPDDPSKLKSQPVPADVIAKFQAE